MENKKKWNVLKRGLTSGAVYDASALDYYTNILKLYEKAKRQLEEYEKRKREYERQLKESLEKKAKEERARKEYLEKLKKDTLPEEREKAAVRAQEKWANGETPDKKDADLFEISDYKKSLPANNKKDDSFFDSLWKAVKGLLLAPDGITATGWKMNDIQASQFSGNLAMSKEDQQLINMAENYFKGNKTAQNVEAVRELNRRKPGILNSAAVYANKALDWIGNNSVTGTTGAFLGTNELDKVRINIGFDENTQSDQALQNIAALRNSYKAFDEESYNAYLENKNKAKYYENLLDSEYKRKLNVAEGRIPDENGNIDGSVEFFNFSKLRYQLPGIIAGSISSPALFVSSLATGAMTAGRVLATATAATAAVVGTGGWGSVALPATLSLLGTGATFGLNLAQGGHENAAEVDEGYISKVKYALDLHPGIAADFYKMGRSVLGEHATQEEIITAKLANKIPSTNTIVEKAFDDAAIGGQRLYDRDMVATTADSTIDTALQITPIKFFSTVGKAAIKQSLRSSRIARAAARVGRGLDKLNGGTDGVLRNAFAKYGAIVSPVTAGLGGATGTVLDNVVGRIPKVNTLIKSIAHFDIPKIKRIGPKASNWINYTEGILGKGLKSSLSEGIEEGKQYYNQQIAVKEFQDGLRNGNLSYETQSIISDLLDDFEAGNFAAAGIIHAITGIPLLDSLHYTDENIINAAEAIKNIKSGMIGGHALTSVMTALNNFKQTKGTGGSIDAFEEAIRAFELNKLTALKLFAVDLVFSRTNHKYVYNAIDYLKNSSSINLNDQELEDLAHRAIEVRGVSESPYVKSLAKEMGIANEDYHKFVADYMYHKDILDTERENLQGATRDLRTERDKSVARSRSIENYSKDVFEQWRKNDMDNDRRRFENDKSSLISKLEKHILSLNDKLKTEALTNSERAKVQKEITDAEESLNRAKDAKFNESETAEYSDARFGRINALATIRGTIKQLNFLEAILSSMWDENVEGRKFIESQIDVTKKLLNDQLAGNTLDDKLLTADNLAEVNRWANIVARNIERADKDNPAIAAASDELIEEIDSLSQAYQEHAKAVLDYNIARNLFYDFVGYDTKDGQIVEEGTEGAKHVKGNAKEHLEGIMSAQDDDAKLEQAYQQGFANYGFSGVYKNESPLVLAEEEEEERSNPGTRERRSRIKQLGRNIRDFIQRSKDYVSGTWKNFGFKRVFVLDDASERTSLDPSENQLDAQEYFLKIVADYKAAHDVDKWLDAPSIDEDETGNIKTNAHLLMSAYLNTLDVSDDISVVYGNMDEGFGKIYYGSTNIGHILVHSTHNKADGDPINDVIIYAVQYPGDGRAYKDIDLERLNDNDYLESLVDSLNPIGITRTVQENGKIRLSLPSHTEDKPRQVVLDPQGDNKYYVHFRIWDDVDKKVPGNISDEEKKQLFDAVYDELPDGAEILLPKSGPGYYATRGTISLLQRLKKDTRFTPGTEGIVEYLDKDGKTVKKYKGTSFVKAPREFTSSEDITEEQTAKITILTDLSLKMNEKFDTSLRTSSHYFEWVGTGEDRRLKLWHRLHDEIGSHFNTNPIDRKNWSNCIKKLYTIVYHTGYIEEDGTSDGIKDIQALLDYLQNTYKNSNTINEPTLLRISGYIKYLEQEGNNISDSDLYECIKGISEEIVPEVKRKNGYLSLDRGTAVDNLCRVIFGTKFSTPQEAIESCKTVKTKTKTGYEVLASEFFTEQGFEEVVTHLWNTRKVYTEVLGYVLWTAPFTIYTEEFTNRGGNSIRIAGEVDMLAIDKNGRVIIIDYKTSKHSFFNEKRNGFSTYFKEQGDSFNKSPLEQYTNQQSAYIQMLNETTRKETSVEDGFLCNEARLLPIVLTTALDVNRVNKVDVEFSKDLQLVLKTIPFKKLADKQDLIMDREEYRTKLSNLSKLYAKADHIANYLEVYYAHIKNRDALEQIRSIKKDLDSILLSLQEVTLDDLNQYEEDIIDHITTIMSTYFNNKESIDELFVKYKAGELRIEDEEGKARSYNNIDWDNRIYDEDIELLGGFSAMGVKDRKEYDEKVEELAHVACNRDFLSNSSAKLTAVLYKTRLGNDKISVYATITYKGTTYPPIRLYLSKTNGLKFAQDVLDGNIFGGNIQTTIGLLSKCSDGKQHLISESKQLIDAIGGTEEDPYRNFTVNVDRNQNVAVVTFNKTTGVLTTISRTGSGEIISLPKTLKNSSTNGHIVINVIPDNSSTGNPIPIVCNTSEITEVLGKDASHYRNVSLLEFIVEDVLLQINRTEGGNVLDKRYVTENGEEIPLTLGQILNFFFEPFNPDNGSLVERPQYEITTGVGQSRYIRIGNFSDTVRAISLDDIAGLKKAIMGLNIWISANMAGVKWNASDGNSIQFNEFAEWLRGRTEKFYLGKTGIYFDKSDADGTYLGFLAKNGLLHTPFNGFSHPLISINTCQKEAPVTPTLNEGDSGNNNNPPPSGRQRRKKEEPRRGGTDANIGWESALDSFMAEVEANNAREDDGETITHIDLKKLQQGRYELDESAARLYIEQVLGKSFADSKLEFVDEISSAIVGGLSVGTIIAGQVTANMMKLSHYAQTGTEYHEAFHWAFELIIDPRDSRHIRNIVRRKYGITDERKIAEWLADTYMTYISTIYKPNTNILQKAFNKIKQWGITFSHMFTGEYLIYKLYNAIHRGDFANKPINNKAVLRFLKKFIELNSKLEVPGFKKDGLEYRYVQGPIDHRNNIAQLAFFALTSSSSSPALNYARNTSLTINLKSILEKNYFKEAMMQEHYKDGKRHRGFETNQLEAARKLSKYRPIWDNIDTALALRELLDDDHIEKTNEYVNAYIDNLIGVKGKDLSLDSEDGGDDEKQFDRSYIATEDGEPSDAGGNREHMIPDHQISRMSKTSSRVKLFFATIPIVRWSNTDKRYNYARNRFGKFGYYELKDIYQTIQNSYHSALSQLALWEALEYNSANNDMIASLCLRLNGLRKLASEGNNNAIGLLNEIYKDIVSSKLQQEVIKTKYDKSNGKLSYRHVDIMVQNNSFALCREFSNTVFGNFNKFYQQIPFIDEAGNKTWGIAVRSKIEDDATGEPKSADYRVNVFEEVFGSSYYGVNVVQKNEKGEEVVIPNRSIVSIASVIMSYGTRDQRSFYIKDPNRSKKYKKDVYAEVSIEDYLPYVKSRFVEGLSTVGIDITVDQLNDMLEVHFGGTGIRELRLLLVLPLSYQSKENPGKSGGETTLFKAVSDLYSLINAELLVGRIPINKSNGANQGGHIIRQRKVESSRGSIQNVNGTNVFRSQRAHVLIATLMAEAQQKKYEVAARSVDGKLSYAMSDHNTVTAMCDVVFDRTNDILCTKIRQMILGDPFNISTGTPLFGNIQIGSFILPLVQGNVSRGQKLRDILKRLKEDIDDDSLTDEQFDSLLEEIDSTERQLRQYQKQVDYEVISDGGIETGNNENSSTDSKKRGADTIISIITKLCLNMIVIAPFADKSTALSIRLKGIKIPGIDYSKITYQLKPTESQEGDRDSIRQSNILTLFRDYIASIDVDDTGKVTLNKNNNKLDETIAGYVLAEYFQAKKAIQDYKDLLKNHAVPGSKTEVEEKYKTAFNICKKLMFMSLFSGDYVQVKNSATGRWEWVFNPFSVEDGANKSDIQAAEEMIKQFESIVSDRTALLSFVNRHINGLMQHELEKLLEFGIIKRITPTKIFPNPDMLNILLDNNIISSIFGGIFIKNRGKHKSITNITDQAIRVFMYDIVGKSIISKLESERLFTGLSDLYNVVRDKNTRIITVPYQDQAKRIGSFASTGSVGVIEDEDYTCAEIPDDEQSIEDQVVRSVYMNEIAGYIKTGNLNMDEHPDFDFRFATLDEIKNLIPKEFRPIVDKKAADIMRGFVTHKKNGSEIKNNVTDGSAFISAKFAEKLVRSQGAWDNEIARAFKILTSNKKQDIQQVLNSYDTFSKVWTLVIGTYKYTAVGFRTENINGLDKVVQYVNKYSLAPIFPCMCNEKMNAICELMDKQGVDVLMFESAVKVGAHGNSTFAVDSAGNVTGEFNTYSLKRFFLRKQLNTEPNEKEIMKIGIQTVKVALSAVIGEKGVEFRGLMMDGDQIIQEIMADIDRLTEARRKKLMEKLGSEKQVVDYVANFLRGNNVPEAVVKAFLDGIPAEALSIQKHVDTLSAKRILQDIVRINAPGSAFIQRTAYGVEGPNVKFGNLELNDGEELKVVNSDGSMDCVLSLDYFVEYKNGIPYFKLTPKGKKRIALMVYDEKLGKNRPMSFEEIRQWLKDNNVIGKNAKSSILSYRIPTQAVASINALKCVDVIPVVRDTVILPKLFTTITGSDFDIDKLFMSTVWYEMEEQPDGTYKPRQLEVDRSDDSLKNATEEELSNNVINDYVDVLCMTAKNHPEIFYRSIDLDTKLADDVIAFIDSIFPPTQDDKLANASGMLHSMPSMQAKVHDEFLAGKQGIGPFALALVNHVLTRIYNVSFKARGIYLSHKSLATDEDDDGNSIMSWLSAMINKHVDVAKNPDITKLNVNNSTFNVVALLLRLGYGRRTFMFTCQPIMRDYAFAIDQQTAVCKYTKNENGYTDARYDAFNEMLDKYNLKSIRNEILKGVPDSDIQAAACMEIFDKNVDNKSLLQLVLENKGKVPVKKRTYTLAGITREIEEPLLSIKIGDKQFPLTQELFLYLNLLLFNYLSDFMAAPLSLLQLASVIDNERCITSMIQSEFYKLQVDKVKTSKVFSNVDKLFSLSYIDKKIDASLDGTNTIYNAASCMDKAVVVSVAKFIDPNILQYGRKRMLSFLSTVRDGMVAYYAAKFFDLYCKDNNINRSNLFMASDKNDNSIAGRIAGIQARTKGSRGKYRSLRNNLLIKGLSIEGIVGEEHIADESSALYDKHRFMNYQFLRFSYAGQSDDSILEDVQYAWLELFDYPDEEIKRFARDLVVYAFYSSGEMSGNTKLFKYVPPEWRLSSGYGLYFKNLKEDKEHQFENLGDIVDKLCRNLWYKDLFVKKIGLGKLSKMYAPDVFTKHTRTIISAEDAQEVKDPIGAPIICGIEYSLDGENLVVRPAFDKDVSNCPRYIKCVNTHHDRLNINDDDSTSWLIYKLVGFKTYTDSHENSWDYPVYVQTSALGEKYFRNNVFEYNDELEENPNVDAYAVVEDFISKVGKFNKIHGIDDKITKSDIASVIEKITTLLEEVDKQVDFDLTNAVGDISELAGLVVDIIVNRQTNESTFTPYNAVNEFVELKQKQLEAQIDNVCQ